MGLAMTVVVGGWSYYFVRVNIGTWSAGAMPPALQVQTNVGNGYDRSAVHLIDDRRIPAKRDHFLSAAGVTDCHGPMGLAMTEVDGGWSFFLL